MAPVCAINDVVAVRWVRSAGSLGEVSLTLTDSQPGRVRLTPLDRTSIWRSEAGSSEEENPVISIVRMCATLLDAGTTAISPGPKWISVRRSASAARPWRKRKPPRRLSNVDTGHRPRDRTVTASLASSLTP